MRVTEIELHWNAEADPIIFSFQDPKRLNSYNVKGIMGLDADEIFPTFYLGSLYDRFYNMELRKREVVIRVELNPSFSTGKTYSDLRDDLYKAIAANRSGQVELHFKKDAVDQAYLKGHVVKFEAPHSNKVPEVQLTISCRYPMLKAIDVTTVDVTAFSEVDVNVIDSESTAPHGFKCRIDVVSTTASLKIVNPTTIDWFFQVSPYGGFLAEDQIFISSEYDQKTVYLKRDDVVYPISDVIHFGSTLPILFPGDNRFAIDNPSKFNWIWLTYYPTYWGI